MRLLLYNIRYGTGGKRFMFPWSGYLGPTQSNMQDLIEFVVALHPDLVGLLEVDAGSYRSGRNNQAEQIAAALGHYHTYRSKYNVQMLSRWIPLLNKQGNAFVASDEFTKPRFHYFEKGMKRLVIELELENVTVFLVHLALNFRVRHHQLGDLYTLVNETKRPHIVAGDFNALWGDQEIRLFLAATGLERAGPTGLSTFPSWAPRRQLDFILHSSDIRVDRLWAPRVLYSDHLPLVCDFDVI